MSHAHGSCSYPTTTMDLLDVHTVLFNDNDDDEEEWEEALAITAIVALGLEHGKQ